MSSAGQRLDQIAADLFPKYSRSKLQSWIKSGELLVDGRKMKSPAKLSGGENLLISAELQQEGDWEAENIPLNIIYEDESIIVVNKSLGMVVHPAAGNWTGTLLNALLYKYPELIHVPRAGIVRVLARPLPYALIFRARPLAFWRQGYLST